MPGQVVHLLDPEDRLRSGSAALQAAEIEHLASADALLERLASATEPIVALADVASAADASPDRLADLESRCLHLLLVTTDNADTGCAWLRAGATDFVVWGGTPEEMNERCARMIALHDELVASSRPLEAHREFVRRFIHEIKNPLNCIFGYLQLLLQEPTLTDQMRTDLEQAFKNAEALLQISERMHDQVENINSLGNA